jgi:hypothetical protein
MNRRECPAYCPRSNMTQKKTLVLAFLRQLEYKEAPLFNTLNTGDCKWLILTTNSMQVD